MEDHGFILPNEEEKQKYLAKSPGDFRLPTEEEKQKYLSSSEEPSTLSDFGTGVAQGATLGFSDEALGALKAAYETATTDKKFKDLPSLYREYQKIEEQKVKEAQERSPYAAIGGEVVGGFLPSLFTFGAAGGLGAAKGAISAGQAVLNAAKAGALTGAIAGAGTSEGGLTSLEEAKTLGSDVLKGTVAGGTLGGITSGAAGLGKHFLRPVLESRTGRQLKTAFEAPDIGRAFEKEGLQEAGKFGSNVSNLMKNAEKSLGNEIEIPLQKATEEGVFLKNVILEGKTEEIDDFLNKNKNIFTLSQPGSGMKSETLNPHNFKIEELLNKPLLSPLESDFLKRTLHNVIQEKKMDPNASDAVSFLQLRLNELKNRLDRNVPNYSKAVSNYSDFNILQETFETGISSKLAQRGGYDSRGRSTEDQFKKIAEKIEDLGIRSEKAGTSTDEVKTQLLNIKEDVLTLKEKNPELYEKINKNFNFENVFKELKTVADRRATSDSIRMVNPSAAGSGLIGTLGTTGKGMVYGATDVAGGAVNWAKNLPPSKMANKIFSADDGMLKTWADKLASEGKEKSANALLNVIQNKTGISRKAVLFSLLQKPGVREELFSVFAPESIEESLK